MDEYVYYWPKHDVYCYHDDLIDGIDCWGNDYECWLSIDFFNSIWIDKED